MNMQIGKFKPPSLDDPIYEINFFDSGKFSKKLVEIILSKKEYDSEERKGTFKKAAPYPQNPFLVTIPTGNCLDYLKNLTFPSTFNLATKVHNKVLRIFAALFTAIADLVTLPIRLLTAPFFCRVKLPPKETHPLYKLLQERGVSKEVLNRKVQYFEVNQVSLVRKGGLLSWVFGDILGHDLRQPGYDVHRSGRKSSIHLETLLFRSQEKTSLSFTSGTTSCLDEYKKYFLKLHKGFSEKLYNELLAEKIKKTYQKPTSEVLKELKPYIKESSYKTLEENVGTERFPKLLKKIFLLECHPDKNPKMDSDTFNRLKKIVEPLYK